MLRRNFWQPLTCLLVVAAVLAGTAQFAGAATAKSVKGGNGLRVSPVRTDLTVSPGKTQIVYIIVTNVTSAPADLQAIINDFTANRDESGNPAILLDANRYASSHSLKRYIAPIPKFSLAPGQEKTIPVTISLPANVAGGGYFGAIRFAPASNNTVPGQNVSLAGSVGSLILVKVPGDIKDQMNIASFDVVQNKRSSTLFTNNKNLSTLIRLQNTGNVQEQPFGKVVVKNRSGKVLYSTEFNNVNPPANVLPDSIRRFNVPLKNVGSFGKYKVEANLGYGSGGQLLTASSSFYVIPLAAMYFGLFLILFILFLIFGLPRMMRSYNERVIRRAGRR